MYVTSAMSIRKDKNVMTCLKSNRYSARNSVMTSVSSVSSYSMTLCRADAAYTRAIDDTTITRDDVRTWSSLFTTCFEIKDPSWRVDYICRFAFPLIFIVCNFVYWWYYLL